jgi:hypothetical protein
VPLKSQLDARPECVNEGKINQNNTMKKLIISFLIFGAFNLATLLAQNCPSYPYILNITGFFGQCGSADGQVCFDYESGNWAPDCEDITVVISFPTANFNIDLPTGNFSLLVNQSTGLSYLTLDPVNYSDGIWSECFTGTLLVPHTQFTLSLFYSSNPNLPPYDVETFMVDNIIEVGTNSQTTPLNTLTGPNGPLASPGTSPNTPQRIAVRGTLLINQNYSFESNFTINGDNYCELIMMPGSTLEVDKYSTLKTKFANIHGCGENYSWNGIILLGGAPTGGTLKMGMRTTLVEATTGVTMERNSSFDFLDSKIADCGIGVASFGAAMKTITFTGNNNPFSNSISYFEDCNEGIHLENTTMLDLTTGLRGLQFYNMARNGIYLEGTDLMAKEPYFSNCLNGIWVQRPNNKLYVDDIGCFGIGGRGIGIYTVGTTDLRIENGNIVNFGMGIVRRTHAPGEYSEVENIIMRRCINNIWGSVQSSYGTISECNLNALGENVWLSGIGSASHQWSVYNNKGLNSGTTPPDDLPPIPYVNRNIFFSGANRANITENKPIDQLLGIDGVSSPFQNIVIDGGQGVLIGNNKLRTPGGSSSNVELRGCPMTYVDCNIMNQARTALTVMNGCGGSNINANDFSGAWGSYNLVYGSTANQNASTGIQDKLGNRFDPSTPGSPKARYYGSGSLAEQSQYIVGKYTPAPGTPSGVVENVQGNATYPYYLPASSLWFAKSPSGVDQTNCGSLSSEDDKLERAVRTNINLLNAGIAAEYGGEVEFDTKLKLYRHLAKLQQLTTLAPDLSTWYNALSGTDFAKFVAFEQIYEAAIVLTNAQEAQASQLNLEIGTLTDELEAIEWWVTDPATGLTSQDAAKLALYESKKALMNQKMDELSVLVQAKQTKLGTKLGDMQSMNNSIGSQATVSGQNLKTMNNLLLQRYAVGFAGFSTADVNLLTQIAQQCVGQGGEGVYIARALLAEQLETSGIYNDECIVSLRGNDRQTKAITASKLAIMPNPTSDMASVELPEGHNISYLLLLDAFGRKVQGYEIEPKQTILNLNTSGLDNGIYFLAPANEEGSPVRFAVLH